MLKVVWHNKINKKKINYKHLFGNGHLIILHLTWQAVSPMQWSSRVWRHPSIILSILVCCSLHQFLFFPPTVMKCAPLCYIWSDLERLFIALWARCSECFDIAVPHCTGVRRLMVRRELPDAAILQSLSMRVVIFQWTVSVGTFGYSCIHCNDCVNLMCSIFLNFICTIT